MKSLLSLFILSLGLGSAGACEKRLSGMEILAEESARRTDEKLAQEAAEREQRSEPYKIYYGSAPSQTIYEIDNSTYIARIRELELENKALRDYLNRLLGGIKKLTELD
jgi:hypothetical protein